MVAFTLTYALVWLALACYVGWMASRQRRLNEQYTRLQRQFSEAEDAGPDDHASLRNVA